jgi:cell division protease FtsH
MYEVASDEVSPDRARGMLAHLAQVGQSVLYIDEIDGFALDRDSQSHSEHTRAVLVAFLAALDGLRTTAGPVVIGSSNRMPFQLDEALLRAGRLGFHVEFDLPNEAERQALLVHFAAARRMSEGIDYQRLAQLSRSQTPADLRQSFDDALGLALAAGRDVVSEEDLLEALRRGGSIQPDPEEDDLDPWRAAVHEAAHAIVAAVLLGPGEVYTTRIGSVKGHTEIGPEQRPAGMVIGAELEAMLVITHAGSAAESELIGSVSLGGIRDISDTTGFALRLADAGLSEFPPISADAMRPYWSDGLGSRLAEVVASLNERALARARQLVHEHRVPIEVLARRVEARVELAGDELQAALLEALAATAA